LHNLLPYAYTIPTEKWSDGPWNHESSLVQFVSHGFPCVVLRTFSGYLCGYVGVPKDNPFAQGLLAPESLSVHGGVTWREFYDSKPGPFANELFWIGFDCAHSGDLSPGLEFSLRTHSGSHVIYRNIDYVTAECIALAKQIAETKFILPTQEYILSPIGHHKLLQLLPEFYGEEKAILEDILTNHCRLRT